MEKRSPTNFRSSQGTKMRIKDYEPLRPEQKRVMSSWKEHIASVQQNRSNLSNYGFYRYWADEGNFTVVKPRQWGKTFLLKRMAFNTDKPLIVLAFAKTEILRRFFDLAQDKNFNNITDMVYGSRSPITSLRGIPFHERDLFIDEFMYLKPDDLREILEFNWKSVTLFGTLNVK